jgi:hypothetical protein
MDSSPTGSMGRAYFAETNPTGGQVLKSMNSTSWPRVTAGTAPSQPFLSHNSSQPFFTPFVQQTLPPQPSRDVLISEVMLLVKSFSFLQEHKCM